MPRPARPHPLDLGAGGYSYLERPNATLLALAGRHVLSGHVRPRLLDVGCGAGANARALRERAPGAVLVGIEPDPGAAALAREACDEVFVGRVEEWLAADGASAAPFDGVLLSDVVEHVVDPLALLRSLLAAPALVRATWLVSVPNYAVWYNRLRTLAGRFDYAPSGLYDRTHLRFFTRASLRDLLAAARLEILEEASTPSLVQAAAPWLRRAFTAELARGDHLALESSALYRVYRDALEPAETALCGLWPSLLGFQLVVAARRDG